MCVCAYVYVYVCLHVCVQFRVDADLPVDKQAQEALKKVRVVSVAFLFSIRDAICASM